MRETFHLIDLLACLKDSRIYPETKKDSYQ